MTQQVPKLSQEHTLLFTVKTDLEDYRSLVFGVFALLFFQADQRDKTNFISLVNTEIKRLTNHCADPINSSSSMQQKKSKSYSRQILQNRCWESLRKLEDLLKAIKNLMKTQNLRQYVDQGIQQNQIADGISVMFKPEQCSKTKKQYLAQYAQILARHFHMKVEKKQFFSFYIFQFQKIDQKFLQLNPVVYEIEVHRQTEGNFMAIVSQKIKDLFVFDSEDSEEFKKVSVREETSFENFQFDEDQNNELDESDIINSMFDGEDYPDCQNSLEEQQIFAFLLDQLIRESRQKQESQDSTKSTQQPDSAQKELVKEFIFQEVTKSHHSKNCVPLPKTSEKKINQQIRQIPQNVGNSSRLPPFEDCFVPSSPVRAYLDNFDSLDHLLRKYERSENLKQSVYERLCEEILPTSKYQKYSIRQSLRHSVRHFNDFS